MANRSEPFIPYGRQSISQEDIDAVAEVLRSDWLTTGPMVPKFEESVAQFTGAKYAVAVSSGTAALHAAMYAAGIGPGDEVIVPSLTFAATANAVLYQGGTPVFADINKDNLLIDVEDVARKITARTKAIIAVDYAGQPCDYGRLREITAGRSILLVGDACHSIGGSRAGRSVGTLADFSCFSFHPVKHITTGEGGMIVTDNESFARGMRTFRNHGISSDHRERSEKGNLHYEMIDLGFNYRLNDILCALGVSQIKNLSRWVGRRNEIAQRYSRAFAEDELIRPLETAPATVNAHHLYVVQLGLEKMRKGRDETYAELRKAGVGVNCHYPPVHLHPYYRQRFGYAEGLLPVTERAHARILSLPMYADLTDQQVDTVINRLRETVRG